MTTTPTNFAPRNWDASQYDDVAPRDRFEIAEGPVSGGVKASWDEVSGIWLAIDGYAGTGEGMDVDLQTAKRLHADLAKVLEKIDQ